MLVGLYPQGVSPWVLSLSLVLMMVTVWTVWVSIKRTPSVMLRLMLLATGLILLVAEVAFLMPPAINVSDRQAIVITPCPSTEDLRRITATANVFLATDSELCETVSEWLTNGIAGSENGGLIRISKMSDLPAYDIDLAGLRLLGAGFSKEDWRGVGNVKRFDWSIPSDITGFDQLDWSSRIARGSALNVSTSVVGAETGASLSARFANEDAVLQEVIVASEGLTHLSIAGLPGGRHVIALDVKDADGGLLLSRSIGVEVFSPPLARVLLLQHSPSFEWRALQRWLADSGSELVVRSRVSDQRYRTMYRNRPAIDAATLDAALLSQFDLVITDGAVFSEMDAQQSALLMSDDRDFGLLVLLRDEADVDALPLNWRAWFMTEPGEAIFRIKDYWSPDTGFSRLNVRVHDVSMTPLIQDDRGQTLVAKADNSYALGFSFFGDSYRMVGAGQKEQYARLWSALIASLAEPLVPESLHFAPLKAEQGVRVRICRFGGTEPILNTRLTDRTGQPLVWHDTNWRPGERCDWQWPDADGWLDVVDTNERLLAGHWIAPTGYWQAERALSARRDTRAWVGASTTSQDASTSQYRKAISRETILPWLLLSAIVHWLLQRLVFVRRR